MHLGVIISQFSVSSHPIICSLQGQKRPQKLAVKEKQYRQFILRAIPPVIIIRQHAMELVLLVSVKEVQLYSCGADGNV